MSRLFFVSVPIAIFLFAGCVSGGNGKTPNLGEIYNRTASHHDIERNPVIVIPGILGSKLKDSETEKIIWGAFGGKSANPKKAQDLRAFAHPVAFGQSLASLQDSVVANGALDRIDINFFLVPVRVSAYYYILKSLGVGGYRDQQLAQAGAIDYGSDHFTCFQFAYDWRRDISENAKLLHEFILEKSDFVKTEREKRFGMKGEEVQFDIVAHSMGGLLARYYLRYGDQSLGDKGSLPKLNWKGSEHVARTVLIGTPNAGSAHALIQLVEGIEFGPFLPKYNPAVLGTMPAIYQLLPRARHKAVVLHDQPDQAVDVFDFNVWVRNNWGLASSHYDKTLEKLLPNIESEEMRKQAAMDHLKKALNQASRFHEAMDKPATPPDNLAIHLFAGDAVQTEAVLGVTKKGSLKVLERSPGDGTVIRSSALMDERIGRAWEPGLKSPIAWSDVVFLFEDHLGLTKSPTFTDNILYFLLEEPR